MRSASPIRFALIQLAQLAGALVIGITGGEENCAS
jgi:NADPH-dependent curcumin reductase CurA